MITLKFELKKLDNKVQAMKMNLRFGFWVVLALGILSSGVHADPVAASIAAEIASEHDLSINSVVVPDISNVVPNGEFSDSISGAAWRRVAPIRISVAIKNNTGAQFVTYTDHVHQTSTYWTRTDTAAFQGKQLNGLINVAAAGPDILNLTTVPLRAWANVDNSATESSKDSDWKWVTDISFGDKAVELVSGNGAVLANSNLAILYRMSWNATKLPGNYTARVFIGLINQ